MVNQVLNSVLTRLRAAKDDKVLTSEIAEWESLTEKEVSRIFSKVGLKSKPVRKFGKTSRGYIRLDLMELSQKLEKEVLGEQAPLRDYFCLECSEVFESRESICPVKDSHQTKVVLNKAPASVSDKTKISDRAISTAVKMYGMSDVPKKKAATFNNELWASPGGGYNMSAALKKTYPQLAGRIPDGGTVSLPAFSSGASVPNGSGTLAPSLGLDRASLRRPTEVIARDDTRATA